MLHWFRKREIPSFSHPVFGDLRLENRIWSGEFEFDPTKRKIYVYIMDVDGRPTDGASEAVREFAERYQTLRPAFTVELRKLLEPWYKEFWENPEPMLAGEELFTLFNLEAIDVVSEGIDTVAFALRQGWDDASFRVSLKNWVPKGLGVDD